MGIQSHPSAESLASLIVNCVLRKDKELLVLSLSHANRAWMIRHEIRVSPIHTSISQWSQNK